MPGAPSIDPKKAMTALNLEAAGHTGNAISAITGLARSSVRDILRGHGRWGEVADKPVFARLRAEQQVHLEAAFRTAAAEFLARSTDEDKLQKASTYQLVIASSIALDKSRLLAGEPTEIVATYNLHAIEGIDRLASILSQSLLSSNDVPRETKIGRASC